MNYYIILPHVSAIAYLHKEDVTNPEVTWPSVCHFPGQRNAHHQYKRSGAEPSGSNTVIIDANVLTDAGMLRGVVSGVLFFSHLPSLRMRVLLWLILKQNRVSFKDEAKTQGSIWVTYEHQTSIEMRGGAWDLHVIFFFPIGIIQV